MSLVSGRVCWVGAIFLLVVIEFVFFKRMCFVSECLRREDVGERIMVDGVLRVHCRWKRLFGQLHVAKGWCHPIFYIFKGRNCIIRLKLVYQCWEVQSRNFVVWPPLLPRTATPKGCCRPLTRKLANSLRYRARRWRLAWMSGSECLAPCHLVTSSSWSCITDCSPLTCR